MYRPSLVNEKGEETLLDAYWRRNTSEQVQLWGQFLKSPETFRAYSGCHDSHYIIATPSF